MRERTRMGFRFPEKLAESLRLLAEDKGISVNALVISVLWDYIKNKKGEKQ